MIVYMTTIQTYPIYLPVCTTWKSSICAIVLNEIDKHVTHHYVDNHGVQIHYASIGKGPVIVMIHGFPDFWKNRNTHANSKKCYSADLQLANLFIFISSGT